MVANVAPGSYAFPCKPEAPVAASVSAVSV
uniref:Uncharacterized protein n=1 Tax=Anguilla anguilla TaxID=7936 RepID=A0A0E9R1Q6_ANGAN